MTVEAFIAGARALKGARWRHRGRRPWAVDCVGLVVLAARHAGLELEDEKGYGREPWENALRFGLEKRFGLPIGGPWRAGDVAVIQWHGQQPSHVGILADHPSGGLSIIHAHNLEGVVEHRLSGYVLECIREVYRVWPDKSCQ